MSPPSKPTGPSHEARLEAVLESVSDAFYALDTDWRYVVFNRAAEEYFGVSREAVMGRVVDEKEYEVLAEDASESEQTMRRRVSRGLRFMRTQIEEAGA